MNNRIDAIYARQSVDKKDSIYLGHSHHGGSDARLGGGREYATNHSNF